MADAGLLFGGREFAEIGIARDPPELAIDLRDQNRVLGIQDACRRPPPQKKL